MPDEKPVEETLEADSKEEPKEEIKVDEKAKGHFLDGIFGGQNHRDVQKDDESEEPKGDEEPKEEESKEDEASKGKPKKEPKAGEDTEEKPSEEPKPSEPDLSKVSDAIADGFKRAVADTKPKEEPKEEPKGEDPDVDLSDKDKRKLEVLAKMESLQGDRYKGIADKYRESARVQKDYIDKWKKENPGEKFDPTDSEHDAFYDKNNVEWDADDYSDAAIELRVDKRLGSQQSKENERIRKLEAAERERGLSDVINEARVDAMSKTLAGIDEQYASLIKDGKIDKEAVKAFRDEDPEVSQIVLSAADTSDAVAHEVMKLWNGLSEFDPGVDEKTGEPTNPVHTFIHSAAIEAENNILNGDDAGKMKDGKKFATNAQLQEMSKAEQAKHWGIGSEEIIAVVAGSFVEDAKTKVKNFEERMEKFAAKRGFSKGDIEKSQNKESSQQEEESLQNKEKDPGKPTNVETGNEKHVSKTPGDDPKSSKPRDKFVDRLISGQSVT